MAKRRKSRRRSRSLGALGAVPLVLPVIGAVTAGKLLVGGVVAGVAYLATRKQPAAGVPIAPPKMSECSGPLFEQQVAATAASTGTGAAAGPWGAAAGAGIGLATNPGLAKCGISAINKAKRSLCAKADRIVAQLKRSGAAVPSEYYSLSCDQKIALVAALGPIGPAGLVAGVVSVEAVQFARQAWDQAASAWSSVSKTAQAAEKSASNAVTSNAKGAAHAAKNLFGLGALYRSRKGIE